MSSYQLCCIQNFPFLIKTQKRRFSYFLFLILSFYNIFVFFSCSKGLLILKYSLILSVDPFSDILCKKSYYYWLLLLVPMIPSFLWFYLKSIFESIVYPTYIKGNPSMNMLDHSTNAIIIFILNPSLNLFNMHLYLQGMGLPAISFFLITLLNKHNTSKRRLKREARGQ